MLLEASERTDAEPHPLPRGWENGLLVPILPGGSSGFMVQTESCSGAVFPCALWEAGAFPVEEAG